MKFALAMRNKFAFVDGSIPKPDGTDPWLMASWERNNNIVVSWLLNSISKEISASIIYQIVAADIWSTLKARYQQGNGPRIFQLKKDLMNTFQGYLSVTQYFTKITSVLEELNDFRPLIQCECGGAQLLQQFL